MEISRNLYEVLINRAKTVAPLAAAIIAITNCSRTSVDELASISNINDVGQGGLGGNSNNEGGKGGTMEAGGSAGKPDLDAGTDAETGGAAGLGGHGGKPELDGGTDAGNVGGAGAAGSPDLDAGTDADAGAAGTGGSAGNCNTVLVKTLKTVDSLTVPKGAISVVGNCWSFEPAPGCEFSNIDNIQIHKFGNGLVSDISNISLFSDVGQPAFTINPVTQIADFSIGSWLIDEKRTVCFLYDLSSDAQAGNQHGFEIVSAGSIHGKSEQVGTTTFEGDFPLQGPIFTISSQQIGTLEINKQTQSPIILPPNSAVDFQVAIKSSNTEDVGLIKLGMAVQGTCDASTLSTIELLKNGNVIANTNSAYKIVSPPESIIDFEDLSGGSLTNLPKGQTEIFSLKADTKCPSGTNLMFCLDDKKRIHGVGKTFGFFNDVQNNFTCDPDHAIVVNFL